MLLPNLKANSVVVIDNAAYHNVLEEKVPNTSTRKAEIQLWLEEKGIAFDPAFLKVELLNLVRQHKAAYTKFKIDQIVEAAGHSVLRLPPYHPVLNPIENIWGAVKGRVGKRNVTQRMNDVKALAEEEFAKVTIEEWRKTCRHCWEIEEELFQRDVGIDTIVNDLIINLNEDSSDSEC